MRSALINEAGFRVEILIKIDTYTDDYTKQIQ